ncbi:MAG: helix-turn-helix transcriptional regulator [Acinetobacter sp.]|nr:helix-turn-helix transcriptional regulator [Acinetobacter sp.]
MKPNAQHYNPDPDYLRELIAKTGLTQNEVAQRVGVSGRTMRRYLTFSTSENYQQAPYAVQFAIECLAH